MPEEYRLTIRLPPDLYAQRAARGSHGQPLAAILREALVDYLARQPGRPPPADLADDLAAIRTRLESLEQRIDALEAAATRQPALTPLPQPMTQRASAAARLCPKGHAYGTTGMTLRRRHNQSCVACATEQQRQRRKARREGRG